MTDARPTVLFVYYSFTKQTEMVVDAMAEEFTARGCTVTMARSSSPTRTTGAILGAADVLADLNIVGMLLAQRRRKTGDITIPPEAQSGDYDLVVFGSPTWWLTTCMPVRSYLQSPTAPTVLEGKPFGAVRSRAATTRATSETSEKLGERAGGTWAGGAHFVSEGNQVMSMASWLVFMRKNQPRSRCFGVPLPPPDLKADFEEAGAELHARAGRQVMGDRAAVASQESSPVT